jgi:putative glycosyl hydrolase
LGNSFSGGVYVSPYHWLQDFFNAGGGNYVDIVAFHGYPGSGNDPAKIVTFANEINNNVANSKPLWDTESSQCNSSTTASFVGQFELLHVFSAVDRHYWYAWDDGSCGPLWSSTLNAGGIAFAQVYNWTVGSAKSQSSCTVSGSVYTCDLTRQNGTRARAVWNTAGSSAYAITAGTWTDYKDLSGNTNSIASNANSVSISTAPILLESSGASSAPSAPTGLTAIVN